MSDTDELIPAELQPLAVDISTLRTYGRNPRRGDIPAITESLKANGQFRPIVVNKRDSTVLAGNHTLAAARALGWQKIAVTYVDVDEKQAQRIVLADNRTSDLGEYDDRALAELLAEVREDDALLGTGYGEGDLTALLSGLKDVDAPEDFHSYDDSTIVTDHKCPRCGYEFSGKGP